MLPRTPTFPWWSTSNATIAGLTQISEFMREEAEALVGAAPAPAANVGSSARLRHRARNRVVEALVEPAELIDADRSARLHGQVGDRLAHVAVVVHDLRHGESLQLQILPVQRGAPVDLGARHQAVAKRVDELIQEPRDPVLQLGRRRGWHRACPTFRGSGG